MKNEKLKGPLLLSVSLGRNQIDYKWTLMYANNFTHFRKFYLSAN